MVYYAQFFLLGLPHYSVGTLPKEVTFNLCWTRSRILELHMRNRGREELPTMQEHLKATRRGTRHIQQENKSLNFTPHFSFFLLLQHTADWKPECSSNSCKVCAHNMRIWQFSATSVVRFSETQIVPELQKIINYIFSPSIFWLIQYLQYFTAGNHVSSGLHISHFSENFYNNMDKMVSSKRQDFNILVLNYFPWKKYP